LIQMRSECALKNIRFKINIFKLIKWMKLLNLQLGDKRSIMELNVR